MHRPHQLERPRRRRSLEYSLVSDDLEALSFIDATQTGRACHSDMKGRVGTSTVGGVLGLDDEARGVSLVASVERNTRRSGKRPTDNAAAHGVVLLPKSSLVSTGVRVPVPESCWATRGVPDYVVAGATVSEPGRGGAGCA